MIVMITGSRSWTDEATIRAVLRGLPANTTILHGGYHRGADEIADRVARELGFAVEVMPADWQKHGRAAGPIRNAAMAQRCASAIAFWDGASRGTASAIAEVRKRGKQVDVFTPEPL